MKTGHMMSFCSTRIPYILIAQKQTIVNLVPLCDVGATATLKLNEDAAFMSSQSMIILHQLADLEPVFLSRSLKVLDKNNSLCFMYHMSLAFIQKLKLYQQRCKYNHTNQSIK